MNNYNGVNNYTMRGFRMQGLFLAFDKTVAQAQIGTTASGKKEQGAIGCAA